MDDASAGPSIRQGLTLRRPLQTPECAQTRRLEIAVSQFTGRKAVQYLRMSTDHQDLSPDMQDAAIASYAQRNGIQIVDTYLDAGKSGLTLQKRSAMKKLLHDVTSPTCSFSLVLVYDISRWGRFQDTDASAYYEYHCRMHGVDVCYVQEPFANTDSPMHTLLKSIKRTMAAEFSRELAMKTVAAQTAAIRKGFQIGTMPPIGFGRIAVSKSDGSERPLGPTEHKAANREHVRWVLGPEGEVETVRMIFDLYANTEISVVDLAKTLQARGLTASNGRPITKWMLYAFLRSEAVIGNFLWGRAASKKRRTEDDERFRRVDGFAMPIVAQKTFDAVQEKLNRGRIAVFTRTTLLERLKVAIVANPKLRAIDLKAYGCPCRETYIKEFGSVQAAWAAAGVAYPAHDQIGDGSVLAAKVGAQMCNVVAAALVSAGVDCKRHTRADRQGQTLLINGVVVLRVQVIRKKIRHGSTQWALKKIYKGLPFDWVFVVRLQDDDTPLDSILFSRKDYFDHGKWLRDQLHGEWTFHTTVESVRILMEGLGAGTASSLDTARET